MSTFQIPNRSVFVKDIKDVKITVGHLRKTFIVMGHFNFEFVSVFVFRASNFQMLLTPDR